MPGELKMASNRLEGMTVDDVCEWLEDAGFPESMQRSFRGKLANFIHLTASVITLVLFSTALLQKSEKWMETQSFRFGSWT